MKAFRVKDLMVNVIPARLGSGGVSMPGPDDDIDDFPPTITPVIRVALDTPRLLVFGNQIEDIAKVNVELVEKVAMQIGVQAIAGMVKTRLVMQCTEDMPTCGNNWILSPLARGEGLRTTDLPTAKLVLEEAVRSITELEESSLRMAREHAEEVIPKLESAIDELKMRRKA